jgi:hypothetical protein
VWSSLRHCSEFVVEGIMTPFTVRRTCHDYIYNYIQILIQDSFEIVCMLGEQPAPKVRRGRWANQGANGRLLISMILTVPRTLSGSYR